MRLALGLIAVMLPFAAHAEKFTLANPSGTPSCLFMEFTKVDNLAYGKFHFTSTCNPPNLTMYMSGVLTRTGSAPNKEWALSYTGDQDGTELFLLDLKAMTWLQYESIEGRPIAAKAHGVLLNGDRTQ